MLAIGAFSVDIGIIEGSAFVGVAELGSCGIACPFAPVCSELCVVCC